MKRRNFLVNTLYTTSGIMLVPNLLHAKSIFPSNVSGFIPFETYKKDYQDKLNSGKYSPSKAIMSQLSVEDRIDTVVNDYYKDMMEKFLYDINSPQLTPPIAFKQRSNVDISNNVDMPYLNKGIVFNDVLNKESGLFLGPAEVIKNSKNEFAHFGTKIYITHSAFLLYTQLAEYFCYGRPSSPPTISICKYCNQEFIKQQFYFEGDSVYERSLRSFVHNPFCTHNPRTNSFGQRIHDNLPTNVEFEDILPCKIKVDSPCNRNYTIRNYIK